MLCDTSSSSSSTTDDDEEEKKKKKEKTKRKGKWNSNVLVSYGKLFHAWALLDYFKQRGLHAVSVR